MPTDGTKTATGVTPPLSVRDIGTFQATHVGVGEGDPDAVAITAVNAPNTVRLCVDDADIAAEGTGKAGVMERLGRALRDCDKESAGEGSVLWVAVPLPDCA